MEINSFFEIILILSLFQLISIRIIKIKIINTFIFFWIIVEIKLIFGKFKCAFAKYKHRIKIKIRILKEKKV